LLSRWLLTGLLLAGLLLDPGRALAGREFDLDQPTEVTADEIEYEAQRGLYIAQGNVRIVQGDRSIDADWMVFSRRTERGIASGNVLYVDSVETLNAEFLQFDLQTLQGLVYQAHLDTGPGGFLVDADRLIKTGDDTYTVQAGVFTTCRCPEGERDPWRIKARKGDVRMGGYATTQNSTIDILGVPVIWLPWMIFPVKTERESGVLFPRFGYQSRSGFELGLPIFWAARDELNVTFTPVWLSDRGFKPELELEYVIGEKSGGSLFASYIHDQQRVRDKNSGDTPPPGGWPEVDRWAVVLDHDQHLPGDWRARADVKLVSDNNYVDDFSALSQLRFNRYLESTMFGFRDFGADGRWNLLGAIEWADDLQAPDGLDRDDFVLQRLPELSADLLSTPAERLWSLVGSLESQFIYFYSPDKPQDVYPVQIDPGTGDQVPVVPVGDDLWVDFGIDSLPYLPSVSGYDKLGIGEEDGVFQEGEPLASNGGRLVIHPRIAKPMRLWDWLELYGDVGWRQMLYFGTAQDFAEQGRATVRVDLRSRLRGFFDMPWFGGIDHVAEPGFGYTFLSRPTSSDSPIFVPASEIPQYRLRQLDRQNVILDPSDRIVGRNGFALGVRNRFYQRDGGKLLAELDLSVDYNLADRGRDFSHFVLDSRLHPLRRFATDLELALNTRNGNVDEGRVGFSAYPHDRVLFRVGYRYRKQLPRFLESYLGDKGLGDFDDGFATLDQIDGGLRFTLGRSWAFYYAVVYDLEAKVLLGNGGGVEFRSKCRCWAVGVDLRDDRRTGFRFSIRYSILGIGDDRLKSNALSGSGGFGDVVR